MRKLTLTYVLNKNKEYIVLNFVKDLLWENETIFDMFNKTVNRKIQLMGINKDMTKREIEDFLKSYINKICIDDTSFDSFVDEIKGHNINCSTFKKMLQCEGLADNFKTKKGLQSFINENINKVLNYN